MLLCPWDFPGNNTAVGCHFLLQDIFPTQGSSPSLPHCMLFLYLWDIREAHLSIVLLLQQPKRTKTLLQQPQQTMTPQSIVPSLNRLWSLGDVLVISFSDLVSHSQLHQGHYHMSFYPLHGIYHHIPKFVNMSMFVLWIPVPEILQDLLSQ